MVRVEVDGQYRGLFRELEDNVQVELLGSSSWSSKQRLEEDGSWYEEGDRGTGPKSRWWRDMMLVKLTAWRSKVHFNSLKQMIIIIIILSLLLPLSFSEKQFFLFRNTHQKTNQTEVDQLIASFLFYIFCIVSSLRHCPYFFSFLKKT